MADNDFEETIYLSEDKKNQCSETKETQTSENAASKPLSNWYMIVIIVITAAITAAVITVPVQVGLGWKAVQIEKQLQEILIKNQKLESEIKVLRSNFTCQHQTDIAEVTVRDYITNVVENFTTQQLNIKAPDQGNSCNCSSFLVAMANLSYSVDERIMELNRTHRPDQIHTLNMSLIEIFKEGTPNLTQLLDHVEALEVGIVSVNNSLESLKTETQMNISELSNHVQSSIAQLEDEHNSTTMQLERNERLILHIQQDTASKTANLSRALGGLETDAEIARRDINTTIGRINQLERDMETTNRSLSSVVGSIDRLRIEQKTVKNDLNNTKNQLIEEQTSLKERLNSYDTQLMDLQKKVEELKIGEIALGVAIFILLIILLCLFGYNCYSNNK